MLAKGVSRRWLVNTLGVVLLILVISITTLSLMVQSSTYNGIELSLAGRADELLRKIGIHSNKSARHENFPAIKLFQLFYIYGSVINVLSEIGVSGRCSEVYASGRGS